MEMNVVARLKRRMEDARSLGFKVRMEALDGEQASWCEIAGVPTLVHRSFSDGRRTVATVGRDIGSVLSTRQRRLDGRFDRRLNPHAGHQFRRAGSVKLVP